MARMVGAGFRAAERRGWEETWRAKVLGEVYTSLDVKIEKIDHRLSTAALVPFPREASHKTGQARSSVHLAKEQAMVFTAPC